MKEENRCFETVMESSLYRLSNGNMLRVYDMCDDPEYPYGYDYFDGETKELIDGGVFAVHGDVDAIVKEAIRWCDLDPAEVEYELIGKEIEYEDLEEMGYSGF